MRKRKNVFLCLLMALSLVCNLAVVPASAATQKEKITLSNLPAYSGEAYVELNNNLPGFKKSELTKKAFEKYSDLDDLGRCGAAYANVCKETMPTEERGAIGMIKPSGWHTVKYDNVDGKYLYNRCHLIGYQLTGENANEQNLIRFDSFEQNNAELNELGYHTLRNSTVIVRDDPENYRYMQIERDTPLAEVEKALRDDFGLVDDISTALVIRQLIFDEVVNDAHRQELSEAKICQLSSSMIEITAKESKKSLIMPISNIDTERLADIGISEKGANDIKKSFEKSISDKKCPDRQTLSEIKHFAQEKFKEISQAVKDKVISKGKGGQEH